MKKVVFVLIAFIVLNTQAQGERSHKGNDLTPEQMATLRTKQLTLDLELNEAQQAKVFALSKKTAEEMKAMKAERKENKQTMGKDRFEMKNQILDKKIAIQKEMKTILNEEQFEKWKKISKHRMNKMKKHRKESKQQKD